MSESSINIGYLVIGIACILLFLILGVKTVIILMRKNSADEITDKTRYICFIGLTLFVVSMPLPVLDLINKDFRSFTVAVFMFGQLFVVPPFNIVTKGKYATFRRKKK